MFTISSLAGEIRSLPGYVTLDKNAPSYIGLIPVSVKGDSVERRTPSRILAETYLDHGRIKSETIDKKIAELLSTERAAFLVYCQAGRTTETNIDCLKLAATRDLNNVLVSKWSSKKGKLYKIALEELRNARELAGKLPVLISPVELNSRLVQPFYEALFQGLEIFDAITSADPERGKKGLPLVPGNLDFVIGRATSFTKELVIEDRPEATNLDISSASVMESRSQVFDSPENLLKRGVDISKIDPVESGFWKRPVTPISEYDTANYNKSTESIVGSDMIDPSQVVTVKYNDAKFSGTTPKFTVTYNNQTYKIKFYIKPPTPNEGVGAEGLISNLLEDRNENHSESVVNNLAAALGFKVLPTYFKKTVRVQLPEGGYETFIKELESNIVRNNGKDTWDFRARFPKNNVKADEQGREYIEIENAALELKDTPTDFKVGLFGKDRYGRNFKRELRAFQLFHAWINDMDAKDDNSQMRISQEKNSKGELVWRSYLATSDMGSALGGKVIFGSVNSYPADLVSKVEKPNGKLKITLNYTPAYRGSIFDSISINDAKWITRLMVQLTPAQIERSFTAAGFPEVVAKLYTQKMLRRRDQLVNALGLASEKIIVANGQVVTVEAKSSEINDPKSYAVAGNETLFENGVLKSVPGNPDSERWVMSFSNSEEGSRPQQVSSGLIPILGGLAMRPVGKNIQRIEVMPNVFVDGVKVGLDSFMPARYLVENPLAGQHGYYPWWIVDVYRVGIGFGFEKEPDVTKLGLKAEKYKWLAGVKHVRTWEFMRIRAVKDAAANFQGILSTYNPKDVFAKPFSKVTEAALAGMEKGDVLVSSSYVTLGGNMRVFPTASFFSLTPSLSFKLGAQTTSTKRIAMIKESDDRVLTSWQDLNVKAEQMELGVKVFILKFPLFKQQLEKLTEMQKVYRFDLNDKDSEETLLSHLSRDLPEDVDAKYSVQTKEVETVLNKRTFTLFGLRSKTAKSVRKEASLKDSAGNIVQKFESLRRDIKREVVGGANSGEFAEAVYDETTGDLFARYTYDYRNEFGKRRDVERIIKSYGKLMPEGFLSFDASNVSDYCGNLELKGQIILSKEAIADSMRAPLTRDSACVAYSRLIPVDKPEAWCAKIYEGPINPVEMAEKMTHDPAKQMLIVEAYLGTKNFVDKYLDARKVYAADKADKKELLGALSKLMSVGPRRDVAVKVLLSLTRSANYFRNVVLSSDLACFPGQVEKLEVNKADRGGLIPSALAKSDDVSDLVKTEADPVFEALAPYFYDYFFKEKVNMSRSNVLSLFGN